MMSKTCSEQQQSSSAAKLVERESSNYHSQRQVACAGRQAGTHIAEVPPHYLHIHAAHCAHTDQLAGVHLDLMVVRKQNAADWIIFGWNVLKKRGMKNPLLLRCLKITGRYLHETWVSNVRASNALCGLAVWTWCVDSLCGLSMCGRRVWRFGCGHAGRHTVHGETYNVKFTHTEVYQWEFTNESSST